MINQRIVYAFVIAAIAGISSIAIAMSLFVPFSSVQQASAQQNETTATMSTANQSMTQTASTSKNFTLYNTEVEGLQDTYIYTLPVMVVNSGDSVTVNLHNVAESESESGGSTEGGAEDSTEGSTEGGTTEGSTEGGAEDSTEGSTEGGAANATEGRHSFTIETQPYSVDIDTAAGQIGNATFTADQEGIFQYHCKYHPLTMTGQLVVLPSSGASSVPTT